MALAGLGAAMLLIFSAVIFLVPEVAGAGTPTFFVGLSNSCATTCTIGPFTTTRGNVLMVSAACWAGASPASFSSITDSFGTTFLGAVTKTDPGGNNATIYYGFVATTGSDSVLAAGCGAAGTTAGSVNVDEFSGVASIGNTAADSNHGSSSGTDSLVLTGASTSVAYENFETGNLSNGICPTMTLTNSQTALETSPCLTLPSASTNNQLSADLAFSSGSVTLSVSYSAGVAVGWENLGVEMVAGTHTFPNSGSNQPGGSFYPPGTAPLPPNTIQVGSATVAYTLSSGPVSAAQIVPPVNFNVTPGVNSVPFIYIFAGIFTFTLGPYLVFAKRIKRPEYGIRVF